MTREEWAAMPEPLPRLALDAAEATRTACYREQHENKPPGSFFLFCWDRVDAVLTEGLMLAETLRHPSADEWRHALQAVRVVRVATLDPRPWGWSRNDRGVKMDEIVRRVNALWGAV
jgi:hypothetical protein